MRPAARSWAASALLVILLALVLATQGGCGRHAGRFKASAGVPAAASGHAAASRPAPAGSIAGEGGLPRVDPGYLQWLERQSMLGLAPELAAQVSGTERLWRNSAGGDRVAVLLRAAPNWLALDPGSLDARPLLRALHAAGLPGALPALGLEGLYLAPTGERADIWTATGGAASGTASGTAPDTASGAGPGGGVASFRPDPAVGDAEAFERLTAQAEAAGVQLGGELPPAATGLGPDFILQARHAPRYGGIYAMIEVPRGLWGILPAADGEWACRPLEAQAVAQLAGRGLLPARLARDNLAARHGGLAPGGWAATGEVRGADGNVRRWVYRYGPNPLRPVLLWQDPSGQARRILSAAIIQQTGLDGQTLTGLRFEALLGLDVEGAEGADGADGVEGAAGAEGAGGAEAAAGDAAWLRGALMPGLEALDAASQEIHRYGGWAMQADALPPALTPLVLSGSVDFTRDTATPEAAAHALLTGDAAPLAAALRASFAAVDQCRLARGLDDWRDGWREARAGAAGPASAQGLSPAGSPAAVACRALGLNAPPRDSAQRRAVADAALTLLAWRIGLPGPAFFSPQDLSGALGDAGVWPVWDGGAQPGSALVFGSLAAQTREPDSVLATVSRLLSARKAAGLALGQGLAVAGGADGWVAAVSGLPGGGMWVTAVNVAPARRVVRVPLPRAATAARPAAGVPWSGMSGAGAEADGATARTPRLLRNGRVLELALDGRQCGHVLLEER